MKTDVEALRKSSTYAEEAFVVDLQSVLHTLMEEKGVSRAQLASALGVSRARISQMFSSECKNLTARLLARTFHALGETPELTCEAHRVMKRREKLFEALALPSFEANLPTWGHVLDGLNDNEHGDIEVADHSGDKRVGELVAHAFGRTSERRRVA